MKYQKHKGDFLKIPRPCFQWYSFYHFPCLKIKYHLKTLETLKVACLYCDGWTCENTTGDNLFLPLDLDENRVNFLGSWAPPLKFHTMTWTTIFVKKLWSIFPFWMSKHLIHINKTFKQINTSFYNFQQKIDFAWCIEQVYFTFLESDLIRKKGPQIFWTIIFGFRSQCVWLFARACLTQCIIKICLISIFWPPCLIWHIHHCKTRTYG